MHLNAPAIAALKTLRHAGLVSGKWVFVKEQGEDAGKPADKFYLSYRWHHVREKVGLKDFRWHDLRHTTASFLAQNGASLPEIGHVLGHSSPSITAKYAHLVAGQPVTGADKLAAKLSRKRPQL